MKDQIQRLKAWWNNIIIKLLFRAEAPNPKQETFSLRTAFQSFQGEAIGSIRDLSAHEAGAIELEREVNVLLEMAALARYGFCPCGNSVLKPVQVPMKVRNTFTNDWEFMDVVIGGGLPKIECGAIISTLSYSV